MKIPIPKLKAMIRYFGTYTDPTLLGKKKLMKLFYFADFGHTKVFGSPITFDNYVHLEHGPIPSTIMNLVSAVENDTDNAILADALRVDWKPEQNQKRIIPAREFAERDEQYFSPSEMKVLKEVCERFGDKNGKFIENRSHEEAAWRMTRELESIPYTLATEDADCLVSKEEIEFVVSVFQR
jgi:uncharacterized phage-associated protein